MVFDEVDSGVGGAVAEIVGRELKALGFSGQAICVTHLPQVAKEGHHHLRVSKLTDGKTTRTTISELTMDERAEEIARMLGGTEITSKAREHAREMLQMAGSLIRSHVAASARPEVPGIQGRIERGRGASAVLVRLLLDCLGRGTARFAAMSYKVMA
jgi:hypothetical protein